MLCKSWSNFAAIVIRISGIPSSASSPLLILSDSASINKLNIKKKFCISWSSISISGCLLLIVTEINLCSSFIFFYKSVPSFLELFNNLILDILIFLFLFLLFFLAILIVTEINLVSSFIFLISLFLLLQDYLTIFYLR